MTKRIACFIMACIVLASVHLAEAQQAGKMPRIGYLSYHAGPGGSDEAFRQALRDRGWIEGQNITLEYRWAAGNRNRYPALAEELVRRKVDVIVTATVLVTRAAKRATSTIPIVMGNFSADPVRHGLVASLARPGGNITGIFDIMSDLAGKRLELLKESFPKLSRVAHLWAHGAASGAAHLKGTETAGRALGVRIQALEVPGPDDLENTFRAAVEGGADAVIVVGTSFFIPHRQRIVNLEVKNRLPAMHTHRRWVRADFGLITNRDLRFETEIVLDMVQGATGPKAAGPKSNYRLFFFSWCLM